MAWMELKEMFLEVSNVRVGFVAERAAVWLQLVVRPEVVFQIATFKEPFSTVLVGASEAQNVFLLLVAELFGHFVPVIRYSCERVGRIREVLRVN